jgi:phosphatidylserine decarboxylase
MNGGWHASVRGVQPGGGWLGALVATWGRWRRAWLRRCRPGHVARWQQLRVRECVDCTHDVIDPRDLLWVQNVCGVRWPAAAMIAPFRDRFGFVRLGRPELLAAAFVSCVLACLASAWWCPLLAVAVVPIAFALWFFRDPERAAPSDPLAIVAPADGVLDDVRHEAVCPFFAGPAWRLGIYLSLLDVHVQRAPLAARVVRCEHRPGRRVATVRRGVTDANEQLVTWFAAANELPIVVRQVAGPLARRICNVLRVGDDVTAGQRFGLIKFGSRCELWLPASAGVCIVAGVGQRTRAGESVLARIAAPAAPRASELTTMAMPAARA